MVLMMVGAYGSYVPRHLTAGRLPCKATCTWYACSRLRRGAPLSPRPALCAPCRTYTATRRTEILQRSLHDAEARQQREASLRAAAPGNNLEEMAAGGWRSPICFVNERGTMADVGTAHTWCTSALRKMRVIPMQGPWMSNPGTGHVPVTGHCTCCGRPSFCPT